MNVKPLFPVRGRDSLSLCQMCDGKENGRQMWHPVSGNRGRAVDGPLGKHLADPDLISGACGD